MSSSFEDFLAAYAGRVTDRLDAVLPPADTEPTRLHEAMRYAVLSGGKRLRPLLVYTTGECLGVDPGLLDAPATAVELIHAFSLVHDDLPAMDDDDLRRGRPTVHKRFDEATAILAADALQPLAFSVLASFDLAAPEIRARLLRLLADACGSVGMTGGQALDLDAEGSRPSAGQLEHIFALKTGALIRASVLSASLLADGLEAPKAEALDGFARAIGLAFQIRDDLLDVEGETRIIGKPAGSDQRNHKATYPSLFGVDSSRARCEELLAKGLGHLDVFSDDAEPLRQLAMFVINRQA